MKKLIVANWKANMDLKGSRTYINSLGKKLSKDKNKDKEFDWVICPPSLFVVPIMEDMEKYKSFSIKNIGIQNFYSKANGSYTGEISLTMLKKLGIKYLLIGHPERRELLKEDSNIINQKLTDALSMGFIPIYIFGETKRVRGYEDIHIMINKQLAAELKGIPSDKLKNVIFAYLPSWRIGGTMRIKQDEFRKIYNAILLNVRKTTHLDPMEVKLIYGGSINRANYKDILNLKILNGLLLETMSLDVKEFSKVLLYED